MFPYHYISFISLQVNLSRNYNNSVGKKVFCCNTVCLSSSLVEEAKSCASIILFSISKVITFIVKRNSIASSQYSGVPSSALYVFFLLMLFKINIKRPLT